MSALLPVAASPAESEGFDLIGQITPYTFSEALHLIPKLAAQLLARLNSLQQQQQQAASTAQLLNKKAALQQLLSIDLPEQLQQYSEQLQQAAAAWQAEQQQEQQQSAGMEDAGNADDSVFADLLGLGDDSGFEAANNTAAAAAAGVNEQLLDEFMSDADLAAAEDAAAQFAPSLGAARVRQQEQQMQLDQTDGIAEYWDGEADAAVFGWAMPAATGSSALWGSAVEDGSDSLADEPWEQLGVGSDDGNADAFELLFGDDGDDGAAPLAAAPAGNDDISDEAVQAATVLPVLSPATADFVASSMQDAELHSTPTAAASDAAAVPTTAAMFDAASAAATATSSAPSAELTAPNSSYSSTMPAEVGPAGTAAGADSFDDFFASLSLQQQCKVRSDEVSRQQQLAAAAALPEGLKHTMQQIVELLEVMVATQGSSSGNRSATVAVAGNDTGEGKELHLLFL
jgi:hypothetical protein